MEGFETELSAAGVLGEGFTDVLFSGVGDFDEESKDVEVGIVADGLQVGGFGGEGR